MENAAEYLKMGKSTVYKLVRENRIPANKSGREWRFDAAELDDWLKSGKWPCGRMVENDAKRRDEPGGAVFRADGCLPVILAGLSEEIHSAA